MKDFKNTKPKLSSCQMTTLGISLLITAPSTETHSNYVYTYLCFLVPTMTHTLGASVNKFMDK